MDEKTITPAAGTPPPAGAPDPQTGGEQGKEAPGSGTDNQSQALQRKLRRAQKELDSLRAADEERKNADLSEVDKLKKLVAQRDDELTTMRERGKQQSIQHRFEALATKAGAVDPEAAFKLADLSGVDLDEQGNVVGIDDALKALKTARPFLFSQTTEPVGGGGGNPPGGPGGKAGKTFTEAEILAMSPEEFVKFERDVLAGRVQIK